MKKKILKWQSWLGYLLKVFFLYFGAKQYMWYFFRLIKFIFRDYKRIEKNAKIEYKEFKLSCKYFKRGVTLKYKKYYYIVKAIILYNKIKRKKVWKDMMRMLTLGYLIRRKKLFISKNTGKRFFHTFEILRSKPHVILYTKFGIKVRRRFVKKSSDYKLIKMFIKVKSYNKLKLVHKFRQKLQNTYAVLSNRRIPRKRFVKKRFFRMMQTWGNWGNFSLLLFKRRRLFMKKELVMVGGKKYFKKNTNFFKKNGMYFDKYFSFPLPVVKRNVRYEVEGTFVKWLSVAYILIEKKSRQKPKRTKKVMSLINLWFPTHFSSQKFGHPFHLVTPSTLPIVFSWAIFFPISNFICLIFQNGWYTDKYSAILHIFPFAIFFSAVFTWILEVYSEEFLGAHTLEVQKGFQYAILLFILSELMLFISFFWAYFHFSLNSNSFTGGSFTPKGIVPFFWFRIPLLNTFLLLASGISLTLAHILIVEYDKLSRLFIWIFLIGYLKALVNNNSTIHFKFRNFFFKRKKIIYRTGIYRFIKKLRLLTSRYVGFKRKGWFMKSLYYRGYSHIAKIGRISNDSQIHLAKSYFIAFKNNPKNTTWQSNYWLLDTVFKGFVFLVYQAYEYVSCMFSINDSVYGAIFFSLTGLHGLHVFIGVFFLFICLVSNLKKDFGMGLGRIVTFRKKYYHYYDRAAQQKNCYSIKYWSHRIAFDGSAWYWHFVDVVWFFVFIFIYWWGFSVA